MKSLSLAAAILLALVAGQVLGQSGTRQLARQLVVPEFKMAEATPAAAFEQMRALSKTLDPAKQGLNFVFQMTPAGKDLLQQPGITMDLTNISIEKLVEYTCMAGSLHYRFDDRAIVIADRPLPDSAMQTRVFNVAPGVVDPERTRPKAKKIDWKD